MLIMAKQTPPTPLTCQMLQSVRACPMVPHSGLLTGLSAVFGSRAEVISVWSYLL